jgi:uncharacterized protein (TIGR00251 family)
MKAPWRTEPDGLLIALRVTPNAGADRIEGIEIRDDGAAVLRVRVRAVPDRGKANAAVVSVLAAALGIPRTAIAIVTGETARMKTVRATGDPAVLVTRLQALAGPESP